MIAAQLKQKLAGGESVFGYFVSSADAQQAEILARTGSDFLIFDGEHGQVEARDMAALSAACTSFGCAPLMRVTEKTARAIGRPLDFGCEGIVAPMVGNADEAQEVVDYCLYPPQGKRGLALSRNLGFGTDGDVPKAMQKANQGAFIVAQVETRDAIDNLDALLGLERLDMLFVGPADLSVSLGCPMQFDHPDFLAAMMQIAGTVKDSDTHLGVLVAQPEQVKMLHALGFRLFAGYVDSLLMQASVQFLAGCTDQAAA